MANAEAQFIWIVDVETRIDGDMMAKHYADMSRSDNPLTAWDDEHPGETPPLLAHVPIVIAVGLVNPRLELRQIRVAQSANDPQAIVTRFWNLFELYAPTRLVTFNGRGFDLPLLHFFALKYQLEIPTYHRMFRDRYRSNHDDLFDQLINFGAVRYLRGGLDALATFLDGETKTLDGGQVHRYWENGRLDEIAAYCVGDIRRTYHLYLRMVHAAGRLDGPLPNAFADSIPVTPL